MFIALEGPAAAGKTTLRDHILTRAEQDSVPVTHIGQFSWLSLEATRTVVALRAGHTGVTEATAIGAITADLTLHTKHSIAPALCDGHVLADRLLLSSACLLALVYGQPVERYLDQLAGAVAALPDLTIALTTPPAINRDRLQHRRTANRFGDSPETAAQLSLLHTRAGRHWAQITGRPIWRRNLATPTATEQTSAEVLDYLRTHTIGAHR
ncbi:hypothetical protein ACFYO1_03000 [Nocardia sp. NPDC006044]|uniref:hypothetical protein n=1 Tax=Nocardia sp. NPDC006044 TaxID=3364306 RepID=UPI0036A5E1C4